MLNAPQHFLYHHTSLTPYSHFDCLNPKGISSGSWESSRIDMADERRQININQLSEFVLVAARERVAMRCAKRRRDTNVETRPANVEAQFFCRTRQVRSRRATAS